MEKTITSKLIDLLDSGIISWRSIALMAMKWMSEDDLADMLVANDIDLNDEIF